MKCLICGNEFEPKEELESASIEVCDECADTLAELTNGKEE